VADEILAAGQSVLAVRPAQGERLLARASVIASGGRQAVCRCDLFALHDGQEYLCATALGTIVAR
jgi:acyl-coenzyme A thioesterase PaaI-like protein